MTDQPAAIKAAFSDFRLIKGRKVAQLVLEIPIEEADMALTALGGIPQPHSERWVGVARLNTNGSHVVEFVEAEPEPKESNTKLSLQAVMRCKEPLFWRYLSMQIRDRVQNETEATDAIRYLCAVESRKELNCDPVAAEEWRKLDARYQAWKRGMDAP